MTRTRPHAFEGGSRLEGRRVLVTGASSGIGDGIVRACAAHGARVAALARRTDRLASLAEDSGCHPVTADLRTPQGARDGVESAAQALGGLDAVVNNAGVMHIEPVMEGTPERWREMFDVNVLALLAVTQTAVGHLRTSGGGDIVNVSSLSGRRVPSARSGTYSGTKFAVHAISEGMRQEFHEEGIRVTVISPGMVATTEKDGPLDDHWRARAADLRSESSITPAHIGSAVAFALSQPAELTLREIAVAPTIQAT